MKPYPNLKKSYIAQANNTNLIDFARSHGYILQNGGRRALHAKQSGGLYFFKDSNKYYHFSTDTHGGPIDFVMQFWNRSFKEAVAFLLGSEIPRFTPLPYSPQTAGQLILPDKASNYRRVAWYLVHVRGIDPEIMSHLMHEKKLFQQSKTGNCVFVGYDQDGVPKYCSMRGCNPNRPFKQDREYSNKSYPFHISPRHISQRIYVCESPIDAMSHATLTKLNGLDWRADHRISLGCLSDHALERFLSQHTINEIIFCLDNDYNATYRDGSPAPNWGQEAAFKFTHKYDELGYQTSIQTPHNKDFNVDLVSLRQITEAKSPIHEEDFDYEL
ncbi:DUF3991 domain-containing protein [Paenibacillus sp. S150]|uniref:DUF3991 domain-containing protein n=1 Tax=Paenibacillus sp. S150 TaxID=2749826 RepID=UPI001C59E78B|nr:DUF3991 domain-containing protein [Paenibacillus sp. S150]MBW4079964.1 DUF3991 domain-containing protein [Paenibacillus sp. S150]